jgi:DNA-directed RNA polymerase specialized sigma24 family protein
MTENDKYYVERCLDGHPDDFRYLVQRYQSILVANLAGQLGDLDRAEEAAQETLVRACL